MIKMSLFPHNIMFMFVTVIIVLKWTRDEPVYDITVQSHEDVIRTLLFILNVVVVFL